MAKRLNWKNHSPQSVDQRVPKKILNTSPVANVSASLVYLKMKCILYNKRNGKIAKRLNWKSHSPQSVNQRVPKKILNTTPVANVSASLDSLMGLIEDPIILYNQHLVPSQKRAWFGHWWIRVFKWDNTRGNAKRKLIFSFIYSHCFVKSLCSKRKVCMMPCISTYLGLLPPLISSTFSFHYQIKGMRKASIKYRIYFWKQLTKTNLNGRKKKHHIIDLWKSEVELKIIDWERKGTQKGVFWRNTTAASCITLLTAGEYADFNTEIHDS